MLNPMLEVIISVVVPPCPRRTEVIVYVDVEGELEGGLSDVSTIVVETTTVVVESGATDGLLAVTEAENDVDNVEAGDDGNDKLVGWVGEYEDTGTSDEDVCIVEGIGNESVEVGVEVGANPDVDGELVESDGDGGDKIDQDEVNVVPDVVNRDVSEAETPESELKPVEGGELVPALALVLGVSPGKPEVEDTLKSKYGQR